MESVQELRNLTHSSKANVASDMILRVDLTGSKSVIVLSVSPARKVSIMIS